MSNRTRAVLGEPEHLLETMIVTSGRRPLHLWRVWQARDSVIVGARRLDYAEDASAGLFQLQGSFLHHFFQLLAAEHRLALRTHQKRSRGGRVAVQQMELERRRLGRELHTGVGQMLAAIRLQVDLVSSQLPEPSAQVHQALERIGELANDTLEQLRAISRRLHPPEWQKLALDDAIRQLWEISGIPRRFEADLQLSVLPREPDLEVKVLLYRTMQEALANLLRHSNATRVTASLGVAGDRITLAILDNGVGFDVERLLRGPADIAGGIGLRSVREQAEALGGEMSIESGSSGTKLVVSVAMSPAET
jgi:signal transduction histidine kinase